MWLAVRQASVRVKPDTRDTRQPASLYPCHHGSGGGSSGLDAPRVSRSTGSLGTEPGERRRQESRGRGAFSLAGGHFKCEQAVAIGCCCITVSEVLLLRWRPDRGGLSSCFAPLWRCLNKLVVMVESYLHVMFLSNSDGAAQSKHLKPAHKKKKRHMEETLRCLIGHRPGWIDRRICWYHCEL